MDAIKTRVSAVSRHLCRTSKSLNSTYASLSTRLPPPETAISHALAVLATAAGLFLLHAIFAALLHVVDALDFADLLIAPDDLAAAASPWPDTAGATAAYVLLVLLVLAVVPFNSYRRRRSRSRRGVGFRSSFVPDPSF
ncbi:hypothetical protein P8C59_003594 [Phyllachora maydis]|uniref:Uncharacterized protein n=1 Tax=Phyllachora maydis TaxID=1825666 RepID=A0AAD9M9F4_9PEZI|nr:hypothetical protein P8C59_003594 [Phyllachora maydis]